MPCLETLRLKTGQLVTEDWYDELCDFLCELGYGGVIAYGYVSQDLVPMINCMINLGIPLKNFKELHCQYGYFTDYLAVNGKVVLKDGDCITVGDFGADAEQDLEDATKDGIDASVDVEAIKNSVSNLDIALSDLRDTFKPVLLASSINAWQEGGADVFSPDELALHDGRVRARFCISYYAYAYLKHKGSGEGVSVIQTLNAGLPLSARAWYEFDFTVMQGDYVNCRISPSSDLTLFLYNIPNA